MQRNDCSQGSITRITQANQRANNSAANSECVFVNHVENLNNEHDLLAAASNFGTLTQDAWFLYY